MASTTRNPDFERLLRDFVLSSDHSFETLKNRFSKGYLHHLHEPRFQDEALELLNRPSDEIESPNFKYVWNVGVLFLLRCIFFAAPVPIPFTLSLGQLAELALAVHASRVLPDDVHSQCSRVFQDLAARDAWLCSYPSKSTRGRDLLQQYAELAAQQVLPIVASADAEMVDDAVRPPFEETIPTNTQVVSLMDEFRDLFESTAVSAPVQVEVSEVVDEATDIGPVAARHPVSSVVPEIDPRFGDSGFIENDLHSRARVEENQSNSLEDLATDGMPQEMRFLELLEQHAGEVLVSGFMKRTRKKRAAPNPVVQPSLVLFDEVGVLNAPPSDTEEAVQVKRNSVRKRKRPRKSSGLHESSMQSGLLALEELEAHTRDLLTSLQG